VRLLGFWFCVHKKLLLIIIIIIIIIIVIIICVEEAQVYVPSSINHKSYPIRASFIIEMYCRHSPVGVILTNSL